MLKLWDGTLCTADHNSLSRTLYLRGVFDATVNRRFDDGALKRPGVERFVCDGGNCRLSHPVRTEVGERDHTLVALNLSADSQHRRTYFLRFLV